MATGFCLQDRDFLGAVLGGRCVHDRLDDGDDGLSGDKSCKDESCGGVTARMISSSRERVSVSAPPPPEHNHGIFLVSSLGLDDTVVPCCTEARVGQQVGMGAISNIIFCPEKFSAFYDLHLYNEMGSRNDYSVHPCFVPSHHSSAQEAGKTGES